MVATPTLIQSIGAALFAIALVHTFSTKFFERLAHRRPDHAGIWHLLGEVEIVFGVWAGALILAMMLVAGRDSATHYLDSRDFTEPLFVFAIMVIAGSRPILELANAGVRAAAQALPMPRRAGHVLLGARLRAAARVVHHRAGRDDARRAHPARPLLRRGALQPASLRHGGHALRRTSPSAARSPPSPRRPC